MITEEIVHVNGIPKKLVVFLHGYQDYAEHIERKTTELLKIDDCALHIPQAPFRNEIDENKRQWYSIHQYDPNDTRRQNISWEEFVALYNRMTLGLEEAKYYILDYVDSLLYSYGLSYADLFLCGFSQGAMCAMYSGLMCPHKIAGIISFSGILAAEGYVKKHAQSNPDCLLLHGDADDKIRPAALERTEQSLKELNCKVETELFSGGHKIMPETMDRVIKFINKRSK